MVAAYGGETTPSVNRENREFRLLIVEDHPETVILLVYLLKDIGLVHTAGSIGEALAMAQEVPYDLLVVDINLGEERTGGDLLRALREHPQYRDVPVIACTAYALPGDRTHLLEQGFDGYVAKPFTKRQLLQEIERVRERGERPPPPERP